MVLAYPRALSQTVHLEALAGLLSPQSLQDHVPGAAIGRVIPAAAQLKDRGTSGFGASAFALPCSLAASHVKHLSTAVAGLLRPQVVHVQEPAAAFGGAKPA